MFTRHGIGIISILFIAAAILAGCGAAPQKTATPAPAGKTTPAADLADCKRMKPGQACELRLSGNPTTGYSWDVSQIDEKVVRLLSSDYVSDVQGTTPMAGAGGTFVFRFQAVGAGKTTVKLVYHRPWEKNVEPLKTQDLEVAVQ